MIIQHIRKIDKEGNLISKGGVTLAINVQDYGNEPPTIVFNYSKCCNRDSFCKKEGARIASERLVKQRHNWTSVFSLGEVNQFTILQTVGDQIEGSLTNPGVTISKNELIERTNILKLIDRRLSDMEAKHALQAKMPGKA